MMGFSWDLHFPYGISYNKFTVNPIRKPASPSRLPFLRGSQEVLCIDSSEAALELLRRSAAMNAVQDRVRRSGGARRMAAVTMWGPLVISWFRFNPVTIVINTINHSEIGLMFTN